MTGRPDTQKPLTVLGSTLPEVWWSFPGIPALRRWRQGDEEFKIIFSGFKDSFTLQEPLATKQNNL